MSLKPYCDILEDHLSHFDGTKPFSLALRSNTDALGVFAKLFFKQHDFNVITIRNGFMDIHGNALIPDSTEEIQQMIEQAQEKIKMLHNPLLIIEDFQNVSFEYQRPVIELLQSGLMVHTQSTSMDTMDEKAQKEPVYAPVIVTGKGIFYEAIQSFTYDKHFTGMDFWAIDNNPAVKKSYNESFRQTWNILTEFQEFHTNLSKEFKFLNKLQVRTILRTLELEKIQMKNEDYTWDISMFKKNYTTKNTHQP